MSPFPKAKFWFISVPFFSDRAFLLERAWSFGGRARASGMLVQRHEPSTRRCKLLLLRSLSHLGILPLGHLPQPTVTRENYMKWCRSFHFVISLNGISVHSILPHPRVANLSLVTLPQPESRSMFTRLSTFYQPLVIWESTSLQRSAPLPSFP